MDYETIIRNSNTIFSTMICPKCGKPLIFETDLFQQATTGYCSIEAYCAQKCYKKSYSIDSICEILNNNGLNNLVQPQSTNMN